MSLPSLDTFVAYLVLVAGTLVAFSSAIALGFGLVLAFSGFITSTEQKLKDQFVKGALPYLGLLALGLGLGAWAMTLIMNGNDRLERHAVVVTVESAALVATLAPPPLGTIPLLSVTEAGIVVDRDALDSFLSDSATVDALGTVLAVIRDGNIAFDVVLTNGSSADVDDVQLTLKVAGRIGDLQRKEGAQDCGPEQLAAEASTVRIDCDVDARASVRLGVLLTLIEPRQFDASEILESIRSQLPAALNVVLEPTLPPLPIPEAPIQPEGADGEEQRPPKGSDEPASDEAGEAGETGLQRPVVFIYFLPGLIVSEDTGIGLEFTQLDPSTLQVRALFISPKPEILCIQAKGGRIQASYKGLATAIELHDC